MRSALFCANHANQTNSQKKRKYSEMQKKPLNHLKNKIFLFYILTEFAMNHFCRTVSTCILSVSVENKGKSMRAPIKTIEQFVWVSMNLIGRGRRSLWRLCLKSNGIVFSMSLIFLPTAFYSFLEGVFYDLFLLYFFCLVYALS